MYDARSNAFFMNKYNITGTNDGYYLRS